MEAGIALEKAVRQTQHIKRRMTKIAQPTCGQPSCNLHVDWRGGAMVVLGVGHGGAAAEAVLVSNIITRVLPCFPVCWKGQGRKERGDATVLQWLCLRNAARGTCVVLKLRG